MTYIFILGSAPDLAAFELKTVLHRHQISLSRFERRESVVIVEVDHLDSSLLSNLGGTVKVAELFQELPNLGEDRLISSITTHLVSRVPESDRITFAVSSLKNPVSPHLLRRVKSLLEEKGYKARFLLPEKGKTDLSSVVVKKQSVREILVLPNGGAINLGEVFWVQDFVSWGKRDFGRPEAESKIGMLPPKVARMMVNIALPNQFDPGPPLLLDPFCGVGTILAEALVLGATVVGSDLDPAQIRRTEANLNWLRGEYPQIGNFQLLCASTDSLGSKINIRPQAIVTEPDLGTSDIVYRRLSPAVLKSQILRLTELYLQSLAHWRTLLKLQSRVVIIFPDYRLQGPLNGVTINVSDIVDKAKIMGYSVVGGPFSYARPGAVVGRIIYAFELTHGSR